MKMSYPGAPEPPGQGGWLPLLPKCKVGEGGMNALFVQDEGTCQSKLLPSKYYGTFQFTKSLFQYLFDFRCFKIQPFLHEIA